MILIAILLFISFVSKAFMDISSKDGFSHYWWNKTESWQNKYSVPLKPKYKHWYYFGIIKPVYKERFIFSSTALVFLTDGWHLLQFLFLNCLFLSISLPYYNYILVFVVVRIYYSVIFNIFYK